mgnify:CR=1 FL=1
MQPQTMGPRKGGYIVSEQGAISRDERNVIGGQYKAGTVLAEKADGDLTQLNPAANDGTEVAKAILFETTDATVARRKVVSSRLTEVNASLLVWPDSITEEQTTTALAQLASTFIIAR